MNLDTAARVLEPVDVQLIRPRAVEVGAFHQDSGGGRIQRYGDHVFSVPGNAPDCKFWFPSSSC